MNREVKYIDLGLIPFAEAWEIQQKIFQQLISAKTNSSNIPGSEEQAMNHLLFCEHPPVYTLGKSGSDNNLLASKELLQQKGAGFYHIDRGGDITFHGPGQLVGYPLLDLHQFKMGVKDYVFHLEETIIQLLHMYGLEGSRLAGATGVWLDTDIPGKTRKICAIGVKISRWVSMHGFALNVNTDLSFFELINPCGFTDKAVTSIQKETGEILDMQILKDKMKDCFSKVFDASIKLSEE